MNKYKNGYTVVNNKGSLNVLEKGGKEKEKAPVYLFFWPVLY